METIDEPRKGRGGARPGCGRKAKPFDKKASEVFQLRFQADEMEELREFAVKNGCSVALAIRLKCFPRKRRQLLKK